MKTVKEIKEHYVAHLRELNRAEIEAHQKDCAVLRNKIRAEKFQLELIKDEIYARDKIIPFDKKSATPFDVALVVS